MSQTFGWGLGIDRDICITLSSVGCFRGPAFSQADLLRPAGGSLGAVTR